MKAKIKPKLLRLPEETINGIDKLRKADSRSFNNYVAIVLAQHVKSQSK
jgi:hypothetical protein